MTVPDLMMPPISAGASLPVPAPSKWDQESPTDFRLLRKLVWIYLFLWVFEGTLRKWILPGLSNPLVIIRDPILIWIYVLTYFKGIYPRTAFMGWIAGLGAFALFISIAATDTPILVDLYGLRCGYVHLPLIFVLAAIFDSSDVQRVGKWAMLLGPPMALLVLLQFRAGGNSWLNYGAGGGAGGMIESAYGHIRPSGTFSFTNGLSGFTVMIAASFLYHLLEKRVYPRWLWWLSVPVLTVLIILSGSRLAVGMVGLLVAAVLFISVVQPRYAAAVFKLLAIGAVGLVILSSFAVFADGLQVFAYRFGNADNVQTGFFKRFFDSFLLPFETVKDAKLFGEGLGMGTNVAAVLINGRRGFLVAEGEPARVILESGPIAGFAYLGLRVAITVYLGLTAYRALKEKGLTLPLLLFAGCFNDVLQGQFSQPTELGYATIAAGLCLAATKPARTEPDIIIPPPARASQVIRPLTNRPPDAPALRRGRSVHAIGVNRPDDAE